MPVATQAEGNKQHHVNEVQKHGIHLSAEVRVVLLEEMVSLEKAMKGLVSFIAAGDWDKIAETANNMQSSYIMKQKLTGEQVEELHNKLPKGFKSLDRQFHKRAGMLVRVAEQKDGELVAFYFYKLNESCIECHSTYALERFPGFIGGHEEVGQDGGRHH
jgi:hypothetical protein